MSHLSVGPSVCPVNSGKMANWIWMSFGMVGRQGPRMRQVVGIGNHPQRNGQFWGGYGALHCNQWALCHEPIELPFGVASRVGPGIGILDRSMCPKGKGRFSSPLV